MTFKQYQRGRNKIIRRNREALEHREGIPMRLSLDEVLSSKVRACSICGVVDTTVGGLCIPCKSDIEEVDCED